MPASTAGGFPYVLPDDHPIEYPAASQQMAQKIDDTFAVLGSQMRAKRTAVTAALPAGASTIPMATIAMSKGTDLGFSGGGLIAVKAGFYLVGVTLTVGSLPAGLHAATITVMRNSAAFANYTLDARSTSAAGWITFGGSVPIQLQANDGLLASLTAAGAGAVAQADCALWAIRTG